jgi:quinohemoprotein ethanol dehydrogenase
MTKLTGRVLATCAALALLVHATAVSAAEKVSRLRDSSAGRDWAAYGRTFGEQHYSPLSVINTRTVHRLGLAWSYDLGKGNSISQPLAVDGVIYTATGYSVVRAFEAVTGRLLWQFDPQVPEAAGPKLRNAWGIRGLAWWNNRIYVGTHDGRLIAIAASTGKPLWSVMTLDGDSVGNITGAPRVFDGKVIVGFGGADYGSVRGYVSTYDAETGKLLWRFYTVPGDPAKGFEDETQAMAAKTWSGEWWKFGGGGTAWNAMTYDPETHSVFIGTGNGSPWNKKVRSPGTSDDLFLCSIIALDANTGKYKWHYQINPGETWDYNAVMDMPLATLTIKGKSRKVIMQAPKNGFFYVLDRVTGELISAEPYVKVSWAAKIDLNTGRPLELPGARYENGSEFTLWPSPAGGHNWQPMSFSPQTGLAYIPTLEMPATYQDRGVDLAGWQRRPGSSGDNAVNLGFAAGLTDQSEAFLQAWDPVTQRRVWKAPSFGVWNGGTMATGGGLVFQGQANGTFRALDASSGRVLWNFDAQNAVLAPPITYEAAGKQYVTVLTGFGLSFALLDVGPNKLPWDFASQSRRVLTFALDGTGTLPTAQKPPVRGPAPDPGFVPDPTQVTAGLVLYHQQCVSCHGIGAVGVGTAPDLRTSAAPVSAEAFNQIVHEGALVPNGMPRFDQLTAAEIEQLRSYLRSQARGLATSK